MLQIDFSLPMLILFFLPVLIVLGILLYEKVQSFKLISICTLVGGICGALAQNIEPGHAHVPFSEFIWIALGVALAFLFSSLATAIRIYLWK
jgi:hypothetical protein